MPKGHTWLPSSPKTTTTMLLLLCYVVVMLFTPKRPTIAVFWTSKPNQVWLSRFSRFAPHLATGKLPKRCVAYWLTGCVSKLKYVMTQTRWLWLDGIPQGNPFFICCWGSFCANPARGEERERKAGWRAAERLGNQKNMFHINLHNMPYYKALSTFLRKDMTKTSSYPLCLWQEAQEVGGTGSWFLKLKYI